MTTGRGAVVAAGTVLGASIAVYVFAESRLTRPSDVHATVDADVVAVLPFAVHGAQTALTDLRDAIQDLLAARLRGVGLGAGLLLRGEVAGTPDDLTVEATLTRVPGGTTLAQARVEGGADRLPDLADRLAARLLAMQAARDSEQLAALTGTSLAALRAYLAGRHAHRRGKTGSPSEAMEDFQRALFLDSTFALAGLRLAEIAAVWGMAELEERWKLDEIWKLRDRLGPADRALLVAYLGPRYPRPPTLAELIAAGEQAALAAPHRAESWRILGENLFRFGPTIGYSRWEVRASDAWRRALALDSTDASTLHYLLRLAAVAGDRAAVRRYAGLYLAHNLDAYNAEAIRWLAAVVLVDTAGVAAARSRLGEMTRFSIRALVEWSPTLGVGLEDADRAARLYEDGTPKSVGGRRTVVVGIVPFALNRGRPGEAKRLLATADWGFGRRADVGVLEFRVYAALYWDGDPSEAAAAARSLEAYLESAPMRLGHVRDPETASCALGHWHLAAGDLVGAEMVLARLRRPGGTAASYLIESTPVCLAAADAQLAAARHRPDAAAALERLDALLRAGSHVRHLVPAVANLIAARLYEARGDRPRALAITQRRSSWVNQLLSTQLREEGRLAALVGDTAAAVRAYRHYLALRNDPEPVLRPEVERIRAELERVEGGSVTTRAGPDGSAEVK